MSAWTTERPTKAGLYWYRDEQGVRFVLAEEYESFMANMKSLWCNYIRVNNGMNGGIFIVHLDGEWQPVEPAKD